MLVPMRAGGRKGTGMLHDTKYARGAKSREDADKINAGISNPAWQVDYIWQEFDHVNAELEFKSFERGRGGKVVCAWLTDATDAWWPLMMSEFEALLQNVSMDAGKFAMAEYVPVKRGSGYGLRLA